jgi:hypothetical protein
MTMADRPRRRTRLVALAVLSLIAAWIVYWRLDADKQNHAHFTALRLCAQTADGSTIAEVRTRLADANMAHSYDEESRLICAMVRGSKFRLVTTDYQILFQFDQNDRLVSRDVIEQHTGW